MRGVLRVETQDFDQGGIHISMRVVTLTDHSKKGMVDSYVIPLIDLINEHPDNLEHLRAIYQKSPYFKNIIDNCQSILVKVDMDIASEYAKLSKSQETANDFHALIQDGFNQCQRSVMQVANIEELMERHPIEALSIQRREPYIEPINQIQVSLLSKFRAIKEDSESNEWLDPLLRSINALASGRGATG